MPELPEVETVKNDLKELLIGKTIKNCKVYYEKMLMNTTKDEFETVLVNETFNQILRKGKFLIFVLNNIILVSHLRMEGKYILQKSLTLTRHDHIIYSFTNGEYLKYNDTRKFGVIYLFKTTDLESVYNSSPLNKLGLEPFENITVEYLQKKMSKSNKFIKTLLLDQTIISGLGNIYADEVIFMSKINPLEKGCNLTETDYENIIKNSKIVIDKAIKLGGTTIRSFISSHQITGRFQNELLVHTKEKCPICNTNITKIFVGGRGTYYCDKCQKLKSKRIGITGGIACGKSTVLDYIKKQGYNIFSSDDYSHNLLLDIDIKEKIKEVFGSSVFDENNISRKKLANVIFSQDDKKKALEEIIHPKVIEKILSLEGTYFIEVPLLFEAHMEKYFDAIICVTLPKELQLERLIKRNNFSNQEALARINNQMDLEEKIKKSDYVIENIDYEKTSKQLDKIIKALKISK